MPTTTVLTIEGRDFDDPTRAVRAIVQEVTAAATLEEFRQQFDLISLRVADAFAPSALAEVEAWRAALLAQTLEPLTAAYHARFVCAAFSPGDTSHVDWEDAGSELVRLMARESIAVLWIDSAKRWAPLGTTCARDLEELSILAAELTRDAESGQMSTARPKDETTALQHSYALSAPHDLPLVSGREPIAGAFLRPAQAHRDALLQQFHFLTSEEVARRVPSALLASNPSQFASRMRREGRLLGAKRGVQYWHPAFQFAADGHVLDAMRSLFPLLPTEDRDGGWARVFWCFQPHPALDNNRPADVFQHSPERVIEVARDEAAGTSDADW
jgi:hypothetical protein